jgi:hypothetical protein
MVSLASSDERSFTELALIDFAEGRTRLPETAPGITVEQVLSNTEARLIAPDQSPDDDNLRDRTDRSRPTETRFGRARRPGGSPWPP